MKVIQVNSVCGSGSTGRLAVQISDALNVNGIENYIAYGHGESSRSNTFKFGNMIDAHLHSFLSRKFCAQGYGSYFTTGALIRYIKRVKPDVVHLHNIHGHYVNFRRLFRYLKKINCHVVWTFHDCWPMTGKCTHFTAAGCNKWMSQCMQCPQLGTYPDSCRDRSYQNYLDKKRFFLMPEKLHIVTVSQWLKKIVERSFLKDKDIRCIYNGIDVGGFCPTESTIRQEYGIIDKFVILGVANPWNNRKGYDKFIELARRLDANSVLVMVGVTEEQKATLPDRVIGITKTDNQQQLAQWYTAADVLINLSVEETFGLVVAEALACGTPAIVIDSTACPEVVTETTGIVIDQCEPEQLDCALATIRTKGKSFYTHQCVARAQSEFPMEKMQMQYCALYRELERKK